jgi:hypothetical protein
MLAPPDKRSPGEVTTPHQGRTHEDTTIATGMSDVKVTSADDDPAALRCWTWRTVHGCGCPTADDCLLLAPLPVHDDQPCRGMYGGNGQWHACCEGAA